MLDLFAIARANADVIQAAFESILAGMPSADAATLREFENWVESEALISINVELYVVVALLNGRRHQNTYELAEDQSRLSGRRVEDALRERLGKYYDRRVAFDDAFNHGQKFRYGALNAGGAGLPKYAPYCVVLKEEFQSSLADVAYLPGDSLEICFSARGSFDETVVERNATPHTHRRFLAGSECADEVLTVIRGEWPKLIGSIGRCFEAIFIGEVLLDTVNCVRLVKSEYDRMWNMAFADFGRRSGDAERALVDNFLQLRRAEMDGRIRLEVIT